MRISAHLTFPGTCEAAFQFYERVLGGELHLTRHADTPGAGALPPDWRGKIVHATLSLPHGELLGTDVPPEGWEKPTGFFLLLGYPDRATAERTFAALSKDGVVKMPLQRTFWSSAFGVVVDRFGVAWEINCDAA